MPFISNPDSVSTRYASCSPELNNIFDSLTTLLKESTLILILLSESNFVLVIFSMGINPESVFTNVSPVTQYRIAAAGSLSRLPKLPRPSTNG